MARLDLEASISVMLYDPSTNSALHAWLVKTLEPICDAEPEALATYIVALLKHDSPEHDLKSEVIKQLDEFFENGAANFVETLFATLRSKSYIPYTSTPTSYAPSGDSNGDAGIPIPLEALLPSSTSSTPDRGTKRPLENEESDSRGPPKGPRLKGDAYHGRNSQAGRRMNDFNMNGGMGNYGNGQMGGMGMPQYMPNGRPFLPKGVCRDYHLNGFCSRGASCRYSHDEIAFTPQLNMPTGMPIMNMYGAMPFAMGPQLSAYDPNDARMDMTPQSTINLNPSMPMGHNGLNGSPFNARGELPVVQDLTPATHSTEPSSSEATSSQTSHPSSNPDPQARPSHPPEHAPSTSSHSNGRPPRGGNANFRGRGRGFRGGNFGGDHAMFSEELENGRSTKTIVVEKIPDEHLTLEAVNGWFKRFGTVTNVAVDASGKKALVSFSTREEARAAWAAEEAVFNNRFVKIFWHRPLEGQGTAGARALQASATLVTNLNARGKEKLPIPTQAQSGEAPAPTPTTATLVKTSAISSLQSKEELLAKRISEQKELMGKLGASTGEERKQIMVRLRKLNAEMKSPPKSIPQEGQSINKGQENAGGNERRKKELLDAELDMHAKNSSEETPAADDDTTEKLREKLAKLRAEASALGLTDALSPNHSPAYRGYRGRGRGRAGFRGAIRGGPPRGSMKLDNRTKSLLVKGIPSHDSEATQAIRTWFESSGPLASFDVHDDDSLVVTFQSRLAAEQALVKGSSIPEVGNVNLSWHNEGGTPAKPAPSQSTVQEKKSPDERPSSPKPEEIVEASWGNEEDMGMF